MSKPDTISEVLENFDTWCLCGNDECRLYLNYAESLATIEKLLLEKIQDAEIDYEKHGKCPACNASMMYQCSCDTASVYVVNKLTATLKAVLYGEKE